MEKLLNYLKIAEGDEVHRNLGETDITAPYGIYRKDHPTAKIFEIIDNIADKIPQLSEIPTHEWNKQDMKIFNRSLTFQDEKILKEAAKSFYIDYLKDSPYYILPDTAKLAFYSMYVNSKKGAIKSVQRTLIDLNLNKVVINTKLSIVDGFNGEKTIRGIKLVNDFIDKIPNSFLDLYFETLMISNMKTYYIDLATKNYKKFLKFLDGWDNRMIYLQQSR